MLIKNTYFIDMFRSRRSFHYDILHFFVFLPTYLPSLKYLTFLTFSEKIETMHHKSCASGNCPSIDSCRWKHGVRNEGMKGGEVRGWMWLVLASLRHGHDQLISSSDSITLFIYTPHTYTDPLLYTHTDPPTQISTQL